MSPRPLRSRTTLLHAGITPESLETWFSAWALRREKVLSELDIGAARSARRIAERCSKLALLKGAVPDAIWRQAWYTLRVEVASFLHQHYGSGLDEGAAPKHHAH